MYTDTWSAAAVASEVEGRWVIEKFQYLALMGLCVLCTLPLEFRFAANVWRRPKELFVAMIGPFVVFNFLNEVAVNRELWRYSVRFTTGVLLPRHYPIEEVVFFLAVPLCALLTYEAASNVYDGSVRSVLGRTYHRSRRLGQSDVAGQTLLPDQPRNGQRSSRSVSLQRFLSGLLLASCGLLLMFEMWFRRDHLSSVTRAGDGFLRSLDWNVPEYTVLAVGMVAGVVFLEQWFWHTARV